MKEHQQNSRKWHNHELLIEKALITYFEEKGYAARTHSCADTYDVVCAKSDEKNQVIEILGIEIKSSEDRLEKLKRQLPKYIHVFDRIYVALENQNCHISLPFFVGILRYEGDKITCERDAIDVSGSLFPSNVVTASALQRTIGLSCGIKSRHSELAIFLEGLESLRRKIIYRGCPINRFHCQ